jgi:hypothetical protein
MLLGLVLLAQLTLPGTRPAIDVSAHVDVAVDCGPALRSRTAHGMRPTVCDLVPGFARAVAACEASIGYVPAEGRRPACVLTLPPGEFELSRPLVFSRPVVLRGAGGYHWAAPTLLRTRTSTHGIVVLPSGAGSVIADLALVSGQNSHATLTAGVDLRGRAVLDRLWVRLFAVGVLVSADVNRSPPSNANGSRLHTLVLDRAEGPAILVRGGDANDVSILEPEITGACELGSRWSGTPELGGERCAGIVDRSFLGVAIWGAHTASSRDRTTRAVFAGVLLGISDSARSVCVGCYGESDQLVSYVGRLSSVVGGIGTWAGPGLRLEGPRASALLVPGRPLGDGASVDVALGQLAPPGAGIELRPVGSPLPAGSTLRFGLDVPALSWRIDVGGLERAVALRVRAVDTGPRLGALTLISTATIARPR